MRDWLNRTETIEGAYMILLFLSLIAAGLSERFGAVWLVPLVVVFVVGAVWAMGSRRYY